MTFCPPGCKCKRHNNPRYAVSAVRRWRRYRDVKAGKSEAEILRDEIVEMQRHLRLLEKRKKVK